MLRINDLAAGYGKLQVLDGVSMKAEPGEITVIVGPNGSGKSTLLKSIAGITSIYRGAVNFDELELSNMSPYGIAKAGVAYLPQTESVFANLSVNENFRLAGYTVDSKDYPARVERALRTFPALNPYLTKKAANLSGGERQMLAMGMAVMRQPKLIMFDEPTANLSPKISSQVLELVTSLTKEMNLTTLLVEQNARKALEVGDQAYLLVSGKVAYEGAAKDLLAHQELAKLYLGLRIA